MRIPLNIGQYVPVESPVHRLEPRAKLALAAAFTAALFMVESAWGLVVIAVLLGCSMPLSCVPLKVATRGVRAVTLILAITLLAQSLDWRPAVEALVRIGPVGIMADGLARGAFFSARIVLLVVGTSLVTLTTTPVDLTDGLERLMRPLRLLRVPVGELAMMLTIALRFIPTTAEEAERVVTAQAVRGARFDEGGLIARSKAYLPVLIPLFVNLFRRADTLALAMEARCYRGGVGRTRLRVSSIRPTDLAVVMAGVVVLIGVGVTL